jgi:D-psicose/D-tagatose/L-ribulose 3-epimerase
MKLGVHVYAWCSQWSNDTLFLIDKVKKLGLDFIELPLICLDTFDSKAVKKRLRSVGIEACTSTVLLNCTDITSFDPEVRKNGIEYLKSCVRATSEIEAQIFSGMVYAQFLKPVTKKASEQEWQFSAESLKEVARYANDFGVTIAIEPAPRYETYLINTCEQAVRLLKMVGEPNIKIHLDSYSMNMEEKSLYHATKLAGKNLVLYHLCENDRGIPGTGLMDWDGIFKALAEINYTGFAGFESFMDCTDNMNTWVWRKLVKDGDTLVRKGMAFIQEMQEKYNLKK